MTTPDDGVVLPGVIVLSATPLPGAGVDRDRTPITTRTLSRQDLARDGAPDALRALDERVGAVSLVSASGNPFQPTLFYHGFEASPLQGVAQGLAVYVDGARFNAPFGDTVDWDLLPSSAIEQITVEGPNPVFGLNALGGSLNVRLKTGFTAPGGEAGISGGSFGLAQADVAVGRVVGDTALYVATSALREDGWRDLQSSEMESLYADLGWRRDRLELHTNVRLGRSVLNGPGSAPVELIAADPRAQFTSPNRVGDDAAEVHASLDARLARDLSVQALAYVERRDQDVSNGNVASDVPCADGSGLLCSSSGPSTTIGGAAIPAFLGNDATAYSQLDRQTTHSTGYGASLQLTSARAMFGRANHAVVGASYDGSATRFSGDATIGGLSPVTRAFVGPGVLIDEPGVNAPVDVAVNDGYVGVFVSDTLTLGTRVALTASARFNAARIDLEDRLGGALGGRHLYERLNPALGATWRAVNGLTVYGGYAEANRAPTPAELSCAGPSDACSLANFFVGDPNLRQVVAHSFEAGVRGRVGSPRGMALSYDLGGFRTDLDDDIVFINAPTQGRAYFTNVGATRRQGLDADLRLSAPRWALWIAYSHTEATYRTRFVESGGNNPAADAAGLLQIQVGDRLPGVAPDQVKLGLDVKLGRKLSMGVNVIARAGSYLFGDEANLTARLPGYAVANATLTYRLTGALQLFARVENLTDARYYTFGTFAPTDAVNLVEAPGASNPRSYTLAPPIAGFGGVRLSF